jgi:tRNA pseudouridine38-40 synthase
MQEIKSKTSRYRYLLEISYNGYGFSGSQKQAPKDANIPSIRTVFGYLEAILYKTFKIPITCIPCGRTDAKVHAHRSFCHCDLPFTFQPHAILKSLNQASIPCGLYIHDITLVDSNFHALSSASKRSYNYFFTFDTTIPNYLYHSVAVVHATPLFVPTTHELQRIFCGTRNGYPICNTSADVKTYIRHIYQVELNTVNYTSMFGHEHRLYCLKVSANGFLYKMICHMSGLILHSMVNFTNISRLFDYIMSNRPINYNLASPQGLHLTEVHYNNRSKVVSK